MGCCCGSDAVDEAETDPLLQDGGEVRIRGVCPNPIVSVKVLSGDEEHDDDVTQWVNLPQQAKWLASTGAGHTDRLSRTVRVKVRFQKPTRETFVLKMVRGANAAYSDGERRRNPAYRTTPPAGRRTRHRTNADGTLVVEACRTTAAGLDSYRFEATDTFNNTVRSSLVTTRRMIFYQVLRMQGAEQPANLNAATAEYSRHGIELVSVGTREMANASIDLERLDALRQTARVAYGASGCAPYKPYVVAVVLGRHAAEVGETHLERDGVAVGPRVAPVVVPSLDCLWSEMNDDRDWFVAEHSALYIDPPRRGEIQARKGAIFDEQAGLDEGSDEYEALETEHDALDQELEALEGQSHRIPIPRDHCTPLQHETAPRDHELRRVEVRVDDLVTQVTVGRLVIGLRTIAYWRGGTSIPQGNMICLATQAQWAPKNTDQLNQVFIHELGHKIGMVPTGNGPACDLDRPANQYENRGHNGSHCHAGLGLLESYRQTREGMTCAMFGSTSGPNAFCADCAACVRRRDVGGGFTDF